MFARMLVPEAPVNKDRFAACRKANIWLTRELTHVKLVTVPKAK
jgi:hypothetical protein